MKMLKKLLVLLTLGLMVPVVHANTIVNLMKAALGIAQDKVHAVAAYNDSLWFNVDQELYTPLARATDQWNQYATAKSIIVATEDKGFAFEQKSHKAQLVSHLLVLMEHGTIAENNNTRLHCFEKHPYTLAERGADNTYVKRIVDEALTATDDIVALLKPIFSKSYALDNDRKTIDELASRHGLEKAAQKLTFDLLMRVSQGHKEFVTEYANSKLSLDGFVAKLLSAVDAEIAKTNQKEKKEECIKAKALIEKELYNVRKVIQAVELYVKATYARDCLGKLYTAIHTLTILNDTLDQHNRFLHNEKVIGQQSDLLAKNQYYQLVQAQEKLFDLVSKNDNTSINVACALQEALIAGTITDGMVKNKNVYKKNFAQVQTAVNSCSTVALARMTASMDALKHIDCIGTTPITVERHAATFAHHITRFFNTVFDKAAYDTFIEKCVQQVKNQLEKECSPELVKKYMAYMKQYAEYALREEIMLAIVRKNIQQLLTEHKQVQDAVHALEKEKTLCANNMYVKSLELENDEISLNALRDDRGTTFAALAQKVSGAQESSWKKASKIVTAGEKTYAAYEKLRAAYRNLFKYAQTFDYKGTTALFSTHVETVVREYIRIQGTEVDLMQELTELADECVKHIGKANLTEKMQIVMKAEVNAYIICIKASLKAQIIARWYTHDVAWKMDAEKMDSLGGAMLNGLRKLTPTSGTQALEPLS